MTDLYGIDIGFLISSISILVILLIAAIFENRDNKRETLYFLLLVISCLSLVLADLLFYASMNDGVTAITSVIALIGFLIESTTFCFYLYMIQYLRKATYIAEGAIYFLAMFMGAIAIVFLIGENNSPSWFVDFSNGETETTLAFEVVKYLQLVVAAFNIILIISCRKDLHYREIIVWLLFIILPNAALIIFVGYFESLYILVLTLSIVLIYVNIHVNKVIDNAKTEKELTESRSKILLSQIQPHFMYNSLNSIYYLIGKDPKRAKEAVSTFSDYLRGNINSLKKDDPIPVKEEISHTNAYLSLEKLRFGDKIKISFEDKITDFVIPPLTIQPLVENAIKHGLSKKRSGGRVWIMCYDDANNFYVKIEDDGTGFEAGEMKDDIKSTHIGLYNVSNRLKSMVNGTLTVESQVGRGTTCLITLPKDSQPK